MFGWFKKKKPSNLTPEIKEFMDNTINPLALIVAIAESVRDYTEAVKEGRIEYPAHRRKSSTVAQIWSDVRLEAFHKMFDFGLADLMILGDFRRQAEIFSLFVDERPHLEFPQPRGQTVADTLQAVWQAYLYLDTVGSEVADPATDSATLESKGRDILSDFTAQAEQLRDQWATYRGAVLEGAMLSPDIPSTMIDLLWEDVTAKSKSIAMSRIFGPMHEVGIKHLLKIVEESADEAEIAIARASIDRVRAAREPEDIYS